MEEHSASAQSYHWREREESMMADIDACTIRLMEENDIPVIAKVWVYSLFFFF